MMSYSFWELVNKIGNYPIEYKNLCIEISSTAEDKSMEKIMESFETIFKTIYPEYWEILSLMKSDILMNIYTATTYGLLPITSKESIAKAYIDADPATPLISNTEENSRRRLKTCSDELKTAFTPLNLASYANQNLNLHYLRASWMPGEEALKSFNDLDFYFYIKSYKHWPFYPDNLSGMHFYEWYSSMNHIFTKEKPIPNKGTTFELEHSAYIFEQLFQPASFMENVINYLQYFNDILSSYKFPIRERSIIFSIPLATLPFATPEDLKDTYFVTLKDYLNNLNDITKKLCFQKQLHKVFFYSGYLQAFAETLLSFLLYLFYIDKDIEGDTVKMQESLKIYITEHINEFNYHNHLHKLFSSFEETKYSKYDKFLTSNDKRGNVAVTSFEINYTHNFYRHIPIMNIDAVKQYYYPNIGIDGFLYDTVNKFFTSADSIKQSNTTPNYLDFIARNK